MYVPTVPKIRYKVGTQKGPHTFFGQFVYYVLSVQSVCCLVSVLSELLLPAMVDHKSVSGLQHLAVHPIVSLKELSVSILDYFNLRRTLDSAGKDSLMSNTCMF